MALPADFAGANANVKPGEGTEDRVGPLPCFYSPGGEVISRWKLSEAERAEVARTGDMWISQMTFLHPLQPVMVSGVALMELRDADGQPTGDRYDPDVPLAGDANPRPVYSFQQSLSERIDGLARSLYIAHTDGDPLMHSNRFPGWGELSLLEQARWRVRALEHVEATGVGAPEKSAEAQ